MKTSAIWEELDSPKRKIKNFSLLLIVFVAFIAIYVEKKPKAIYLDISDLKIIDKVCGKKGWDKIYGETQITFKVVCSNGSEIEVTELNGKYEAMLREER